MTDEAKALVELQAEYEAFRREVSDALEYVRDNTTYDVHPKLWRFILPKPIDPLVEALGELADRNMKAEQAAAVLRSALDTLGFEIREKQP